MAGEGHAGDLSWLFPEAQAIAASQPPALSRTPQRLQDASPQDAMLQSAPEKPVTISATAMREALIEWTADAENNTYDPDYVEDLLEQIAAGSPVPDDLRVIALRKAEELKAAKQASQQAGALERARAEGIEEGRQELTKWRENRGLRRAVAALGVLVLPGVVSAALTGAQARSAAAAFDGAFKPYLIALGWLGNSKASTSELPKANPTGKASAIPTTSAKPSATATATTSATASVVPSAAAPLPSDEAGCQTQLASVAPEKLVAQTIMIPLGGNGDSRDKSTSASEVQRLVNLYKLGGVILMTAPDATTKDFLDPKNYSVPLVVGIDQEGGDVRRIKTGASANFPSAAEMAKKSDAEITAIVSAVAKQLKSYGVNTVFAPVTDITPADGSPSKITQSRIFGGDPVQVARLANLYAAAFEANGINPVFKHFGGGSMDSNTDVAPAKVPGLVDLKKRDLKVYELLKKDDKTGLMLGTFVPKDAATNGVPVNQSPVMYQLANEYGFKGFFTTDDIGTKAAGGNLEKDFIDALKAGSTMPLFVQDQTTGRKLEDQVKAIIAEGVAAVKGGSLTGQQLAAKVAANAAFNGTAACTVLKGLQ